MFPDLFRPGRRMRAGAGIGRLVFAVSGAVLGWASPALGVGNLGLGPIDLHPYFQVSEVYDDNVCRTPDRLCFVDPLKPTLSEEGKDWITIFSPGLRMELPIRRFRLEAEYRGDFGRYAEFKSENYNDQTVLGDLSMSLPGGLSMAVKDEWKDGHDPRGYAQNVVLDFYRRNTVRGELGLKAGPKMALTAAYTNMVLNYEDDARNGFRDRTDDISGGTVYFRFLQKTAALLEYTHTVVRFREPGADNLDSRAHRGYLGLAWDISTRSRGTIKGGYLRKDFEDPDNDIGRGIFSADIRHEFTPRTSVRLSGEQDVRESNLASQPHYLSTGGAMELERLIHPRLTARLGGGFSRDQYPTDMTLDGETRPRLDNTWNTGIQFDYRPRKWIDLGLRYLYSQRRSSFDQFEYLDNLFGLNLGVVF